MWGAFGAVALVAAVLFVGPFTFLPSFIGNLAAENVQRELGLAETPDVELTNDEAPLEMLVGKFTGGEISIRNAAFGGVRAELVRVDLDPFDVSVRDSLRSRSLVSDELGGDLRIEVSEREVERLARSRASVPIEDVELADGEMTVATNVPVLGSEIPVSVLGGVGFEGGGLAFSPESISIAGARLPEEAGENIIEGLELAVPLEGLPNGMRIEDASAEDRAIILTGRMEDLPGGNPSG